MLHCFQFFFHDMFLSIFFIYTHFVELKGTCVLTVIGEIVHKWCKKLIISSNLYSHPCSVISLGRLLYFFAHLSPVIQSYVHMCTSIGVADTVSHSSSIHFLCYLTNRTHFFREGVASVPS